MIWHRIAEKPQGVPPSSRPRGNEGQSGWPWHPHRESYRPVRSLRKLRRPHCRRRPAGVVYARAPGQPHSSRKRALQRGVRYFPRDGLQRRVEELAGSSFGISQTRRHARLRPRMELVTIGDCRGPPNSCRRQDRLTVEMAKDRLKVISTISGELGGRAGGCCGPDAA
jgi:hypothetical protein